MIGTQVYHFTGDCPPEGYENAPVIAIIRQGFVESVEPNGAISIRWDIFFANEELESYPPGYDFYNTYILGTSKLETINRIIELQTKIYNLEFEISKLEDTLPKLR